MKVQVFIMNNKTIGPKIKQFRKNNNLTQEQLAKALGYSGKSVIAHIEKGDADMTYEKILLLLKKYKLDANEMFGTESQAKAPVVKEDKKKVVIYIHGQHGSAKEASDFDYLKGEYDVFGLDYKNGQPWEVKDDLVKEFKKLTKGYDEIIVIANSIGAFYTYEYLSDFKIKQAFFISPIPSMFQITVDMMNMNGIKDKELEKKRFIRLDDGRVLSYEFYQHIANDEDHWTVPTEILYGSFDEMVYIGTMSEFLENHPQSRLTVLKDAMHHMASDEEKEFIKNWILRNL